MTDIETRLSRIEHALNKIKAVERIQAEIAEIGFILTYAKFPSETNERAIASHRAEIIELRKALAEPSAPDLECTLKPSARQWLRDLLATGERVDVTTMSHDELERFVRHILREDEPIADRPWQDTLMMLVHIAETSDWDVANAEPHEHGIISKRSEYAYLDIVKFCQSEMPVMFERTIDITVSTP